VSKGSLFIGLYCSRVFGLINWRNPEKNSYNRRRMAGFVVFDAYVSEYKELVGAVRPLLDDYKSTKNAAVEKPIQSKIEQIDDCIKQMGVEAKSHGSAERKMLQDRVMEFTKANTDLKAEFRRAQEVAGRSELIGEKSAADRGRVMDINDK
jgi:hypothetical protein